MHSATRLAALLCLIPFSLGAQEGPRFGVQLGLTNAQGDLQDGLDSKIGIVGGIHMTFDLGNSWTLRPRVEHQAFQERTTSTSYYEPYLDATFTSASSSKISSWSLGLDALYFPGKRPTGIYFLGGLGVVKWEVKAQGTSSITGPGGTATSSMSTSDSWNKGAYALGMGYQFNRAFALEGRFVISKIGDEDATANAIHAVATYRF